MKSKKKQRILALILSMVLMLSASISALAEGDVQTEASGTETTENQAAVQSLEQETVPETEVTTEEGGIDTQSAETSTEPVQENTEQEVTETPAEPEQGVTEETAETTDTTQSQAQSTEVQEESDAAEEIPVEEQPGETTEETATEETVVSEAAELKQEFTDENGNVTQTVTAYVPEGAFQATADQISMEVSLLNTDDTNYIKGMMEELLPENHYLDGYVLYQIDFKVNGEITQPEKAVTITMNGNDLAVEDTQKAHVFYYDPEDPEVDGDKDQIVEVPQKDQLIKSLEESGQSTENIEDYDYSEIAVNEGNADTITVKGWESTIYGCYVEKEAVTELTYEDDSVTVTVSADQAGIIPEGAELSVTPITKTEITGDMSKEEKAQAEEINAQYDFTEEQLQKDSEENDTTMEGFLAYDICFLVDGEEVEPSGDVRVVMDFKEAAVPEGVSEDAEVTVKHLKEDESAEDGVVVEDMTEAARVETTEAAEVQKVELVTESFSKFVISWKKSDDKLTIITVDANGNKIGNKEYMFNNGDLDWEAEKKYKIKNDKGKNDILAWVCEQSNNEEINREDFNKAVLGKNGEFNFSGTEINAILYKDSQGQKGFRYNPVNSENSWNTIEEGDVIYFIFGDEPEIQWPQEEKTVSTKNQGIQINLFDYQVGKNGEESVDLSDLNDKGLNQGINLEHILKFVSSKGKDNKNINIWQDDSKGKLNQGMVLPKLEGGFPVLSESRHGEVHKQDSGDVKESLAYLFNTANIPEVKQVYKDLDYLFKKNNDGYYTYNSDDYYAYLENLSDNANFQGYKYESQGKGFFPFTEPIYSEDTLKTASENAVLGSRGVNHYFGMTISARFMQPRNGQIASTDGSGENKDMIFSFSGDDDVWVFIDDVLVLDLGGIHAAVSGEINFSSGEIITEDIDGTKSKTNIKKVFQEAGVDVSDPSAFSQDRNTFADYTTDHTIKFFYLERGNSESNCEITFNFPTIPSDSVVVAKQVVDENQETMDYVQDMDFEFNIKKYSDGEFEDYSNAPYHLYDSYGTEIDPPDGETFQTDSDGNFTLKPGQMAVFPKFKENDKYIVSEIGAYLNGYDVSSSLDDSTLEIKKVDGSDGEPIYSASTDELTAGDIESIIFTNKVKNRTSLLISKELPDGLNYELADQSFKITVFIQGKKYEGGYTILNADSGSSSGKTNDGTINIKPGQTIQITGLPYGTSFEVEETSTLGYAPIYEASGDCYDICEPSYDKNGIITGDISSISGKIKGDTSSEDAANVTITNYPTSVKVTKVWSDGEAPEGYLVKVQLQRDNAPYPTDNPQTIILGKDGQWTGSFSNLPSCHWDEENKKYIAYQYSVKEIAVGTEEELQDQHNDLKGYESFVAGDMVNGFTITNSLSKIDIDIQKFGSDYGTTETPNYREGAEFQLFSGSTDQTGEIEWSQVGNDNIVVSNTDPDSDPELSLDPGFYYLKEVKAPVGFQLLEENIYFKVSADGIELTDENGASLETGTAMWRIANDGEIPVIQILNMTLYDLPSAGGPGIFLYMIGGTLLLMAGSLMIYINRRKEVLKK